VRALIVIAEEERDSTTSEANATVASHTPIVSRYIIYVFVWIRLAGRLEDKMRIVAINRATSIHNSSIKIRRLKNKIL
jgi:hypothetical protein